MGRYWEGEKIIGLFNFSETDQTVRMEECEYTDLLSGQAVRSGEVTVPAYGFCYWKQIVP